MPRQRPLLADQLKQAVVLVFEPAIDTQAVGQQHHQHRAFMRTIEIRDQPLLLPQLLDRLVKPRLDVGQLRKMRMHELPPAWPIARG